MYASQNVFAVYPDGQQIVYKAGSNVLYLTEAENWHNQTCHHFSNLCEEGECIVFTVITDCDNRIIYSGESTTDGQWVTE